MQESERVSLMGAMPIVGVIFITCLKRCKRLYIVGFHTIDINVQDHLEQHIKVIGQGEDLLNDTFRKK